jgi:hypothetical protein
VDAKVFPASQAKKRQPLIKVNMLEKLPGLPCTTPHIGYIHLIEGEKFKNPGFQVNRPRREEKYNVFVDGLGTTPTTQEVADGH